MIHSSIENFQPELKLNSEPQPMVIPSAQVSPMQCYAHFQSKVCTKCKVEKRVSHFSKDKGQKSGFRPECRECRSIVQKRRMKSESAKKKQREAVAKYRKNNHIKINEKQKIYDSRTERKESKRKRMAQWRKNNPEKQKEIANRSYRNCFEKNHQTKNKRAHEKYHSDELYKKSKLEKLSKKYWMDRELYCECCNKELPKHSIKYCDDCRDIMYREKITNWYKKVGKEYINNLQNKRVKKKVDELTDGYIAGQIRGNKFSGWKKDEMPISLIELKRNSIKLKRELKNKKS